VSHWAEGDTASPLLAPLAKMSETVSSIATVTGASSRFVTMNRTRESPGRPSAVGVSLHPPRTASAALHRTMRREVRENFIIASRAIAGGASRGGRRRYR
jgi:hypothetical protein